MSRSSDAGRVSTISYLEMKDVASLRPRRCPDPRFRTSEATVKQWQFNRFLYALVGADWQWRDKNCWSEAEWKSYVESPAMRTFVAYYDGSIAGYFELRNDQEGGVEIAIFGLAPEFIGEGYGAVLLTQALERAWDLKPKRVWLHTCTEDHPAALPNYLARGMTVYHVENRTVTD